MRQVILLMCLCMLLCAADYDDSWEERVNYDVDKILRTSSVITGVQWQHITHNEKLSYIMGYRNGMVISDLIYNGNRVTSHLYPGNAITSGSLIRALDSYYQSAENLSKTIPQALYDLAKQNVVDQWNVLKEEE